jgi:hypothetical protein
MQSFAETVIDGERIRLARFHTVTYRRIELAVNIERPEFGVGIRQYLRQRYRLVQVLHSYATRILVYRDHRSHQERIHQHHMLLAGPQVGDVALKRGARVISHFIEGYAYSYWNTRPNNTSMEQIYFADTMYGRSGDFSMTFDDFHLHPWLTGYQYIVV